MFNPEPFWMTMCSAGSSSKKEFLDFGYCSTVTSLIKVFIGGWKTATYSDQEHGLNKNAGII